MNRTSGQAHLITTKDTKEEGLNSSCPSCSSWCVFLIFALGHALVLAASGLAKEPLNFVIIFTDDQGYGDMSCNGHPTIHTPHLDRMAHEGQKWTQFYSSAPVCTPSRAALMTGRLPVRSGSYKAQFREENGINPKPLAKPELYHLGEDPSEKYDLAAKHPDIVERLAKLGKTLQAGVKPVPDQLVPRIKK